jgi:4-amino-4-deoxy-L-arabinose transferase-like glycosyltransferase
MEVKRVRSIYWGLWGVVFLLFLVWPLTHLDAYAWSNDEGLYVQRAALANAGYPLYTTTFFNKPPLLIWFLQLAFSLAGESLAVARLTMLCLSAMGLIALGVTAAQLWGRWAGLVAAAGWVALAEIPARAGAVMSDLPALAFATAALGTAMIYRHTGQRRWVVLSAVAFAGAVLIHPLLIFVAFPLGAVLLLPGLEGSSGVRRVRWTDLALFVGVSTIIGLVVLLSIDWRNFLTWVVGYNTATLDPEVQLAPSASNWHLVFDYLMQNWALVLLFLIAVAVLAVQREARHGLAIAAVWLVATLITLLVWSPVWKHYLLFLVPPMVVSIGGGLAVVGKWVTALHGSRVRLRRWQVALILAAVVGLLVFGVRRANQALPQPEGGPDWSPAQWAAHAYLEEHTELGGFVVTDDPLLAFAAHRLVPPTMTGASFKRIRSGYLTSGDLVASTLRYNAPVALFATGRLALLPSFEEWLASLAVERRDFDGMWALRLHHPLEPSRVVSSTLGSSILLAGYDLSSDRVEPGDVLSATLFWRADGPIEGDYTVFVHLIDPSGQIVAQHDGLPLMGAYATSDWATGLRLPDRHTLSIPEDASLGRLRLLVGMYHWPSMTRLPALRPDGDRWAHDQILLTELDLEVAEDQTP